MKVYRETGVILTGVGVYSFNTKDDAVADMRNKVLKAVLSHEWALQLHGFYVDTAQKDIRFDVVMSFDIDAHEGLKTLMDEIGAMYPEYKVHITPDIDASD